MWARRTVRQVLSNRAAFKGDANVAVNKTGNAKAINTKPWCRAEEAHLSRPNLKLNPGQKVDGIAGLLLIIPCSAFALGTWQVKRKKWKEDLIESVMSKTREPAIPFPMDLEDKDLKNLEFRKLAVKGEFDHYKEMFLGPRSLLIDGDSTYDSRLMTTAPNRSVGYYVVTPFVLSDTKERILVNRGWIPFEKKNPALRAEGQIQGEVELEGVVRLSEPERSYGKTKKEDVRVYLTRNVEDMAVFSDTRPVFLDAVASSTVPGGPIGGQTRATFRNEHLSYILTWYSLSAATGYMWFKKYIKKAW